MKYYLYISDSKVDMLYPQVPHEVKKKVATEFKVDLKFFSTSRKTETEAEDNRIVRLETVLSFIREFGNIGSVEYPDQYIEDSLPMRWVIASGSQQHFVYFGGLTERTIIILGGSAKHVLGIVNTDEHHSFSSSEPHSLVEAFRKMTGTTQLRTSRGEPSNEIGEIPFPKSLSWELELGAEFMGGPEQRLEFVAKRLLQGQTSDKRMIILATPLYVALAE